MNLFKRTPKQVTAFQSLFWWNTSTEPIGVVALMSSPCFNPCSGGILLLRTAGSNIDNSIVGFNPCSGGILLLKYLIGLLLLLQSVSILVLVEYFY